MAGSYDKTARVTTAILVIICLVQTFLLYMQHRQIVELRKVDCFALTERQMRVQLYTDLIDYWQDEEPKVAASYARQRTALSEVIDAGKKECDSDGG